MADSHSPTYWTEQTALHDHIEIRRRRIGPGEPVYVVAELSANHSGSFEQAVKIVKAAKQAGADAVKLQTYTPDTLTIDCNNVYFRIASGSLWADRNLYDLYSEAYTPWEWQPKLQQVATEYGMDLFSSPFDSSAVDFLEAMNVPAYKIASFELVDIPLIEHVARTRKPMIMSTGMATLEETQEALDAAYAAGCQQMALLKCTSAYPAPHAEMNLRTIPYLAKRFGVAVGLSDHTLGIAVPVAAVALGACIVEKHLTLSRSEPGPDSAFSLEPQEFGAMVKAIRDTERSLGTIQYSIGADEVSSRLFRRSLFVVEDTRAGERFTETNIRSIRPSYGLHTRHLSKVVGRYAACDLNRGTPLKLEHVMPPLTAENA